MLSLLVTYATFDGHTAKIAERIAAARRSAECAVKVCDLARSKTEQAIEGNVGPIAGGPLQGGDHLPMLVTFASKNHTTWITIPYAFLSVSHSAIANDKQRDFAIRCLIVFLEETGWKSNRSTTVTGALLFREYGSIKRWMMKRSFRGGGVDRIRRATTYIRPRKRLTSLPVNSSATEPRESPRYANWHWHEIERNLRNGANDDWHAPERRSVEPI